MTYHLQFDLGDGAQRVAVGPRGLAIGRGSDNDVVLPHGSVSRRHLDLRWRGEELFAEDMGSTNGLKVNGLATQSSVVRPGDRLQVGKFALVILGSADGAEGDPRASSGAIRLSTDSRSSTVPLPDSADSDAIPAGTIVRRLSDLVDSEYSAALLGERASASPAEEHDHSARGYFEALNQLARDLLRADTEEGVLSKVLDVVFGSLEVDRAFVLLGSDARSLRCEILRDGDRTQIRPEESVPVSRTILQTVMEDQVGLLTLDALDDQRLLSGESIRLHGIRSAMCAPLWAEGSIVGFIQVDSPFEKGRFGGEDLDFLITVANYGAVGVQRIQERRSRSVLERYHSPAVVNEVLGADRNAEIGDRRLRRAEVTVLFADMVGFTTLSEQRPMDEVADLLEGYFTRATNAVFAHGGTLDKFIGDCVMAFFGAPLESDDHAASALRAAIDLLRAVHSWNQARRRSDLEEVRCRIGINSGLVLVGDVGSRERVDYTVLGNTVNLAQRLESGVAGGGEIVLSEDTYRRLPEELSGACSPLGERTLKGMQTRVVAYRLDPDRAP